MPYPIRYYKPKSRSISFDTIDKDNLISSLTVLTERTRKYAKRNVPMMPKLHPQALQELSKLSVKSRSSTLLPVALYIAQYLDTLNKFEVEVKARDIENDLGMSDKAVTKSLDILEELTYITRTGRSKYLISPRLAFYGEPFDWSIALEMEKQGHEAIIAAIDNINSEIAEADKLHLERLNQL